MTKKFFLLISALLTITWSASARRVGVYCHMAATGTQISEDGNIRASIKICPDGTANLEVENLTNRVIFIRRAHSFSFVNKLSEPMFIPQSRTKSYTTQQSEITNEDRLRETKTVRSVSHTNSHTVYDQRVIAIAPHGCSLIYVWDELPERLNQDIIDIGEDNALFSKGKGRFMDTGKRFSKGDRRDYTAENTPLLLAADLEYSFKERGEEGARLYLQDYVSSIQIGRTKGVGDDDNPNMNSCFAFLSGNSVSWVLFEGMVGCLSLAILGVPLAML